MRKILALSLIPLLIQGLTACDDKEETGDSEADADTDTDTDADTDADIDIPTEASFLFTVGPGSDLAGTYVYAVDVTCEEEWGYYTLMAWETTGGYGFSMALYAEPAASTLYNVNDGSGLLGFEWGSPGGGGYGGGAGPDCWMQTVDGWPHVTGTFACLGMTSKSGGTLDVVDGAFRCP